jgi:hypothetical protein
LTRIGINIWVENWCAEDESRLSHSWMLEQMKLLQQGEVNCLVNPDPRFIDELFADTACTAKVQHLYLGGDLSDARINRLCEMPKLKSIVFLFADRHGSFLQHMHGMKTVEELSFERTCLDRKDLDAIASLPHLKSLHVSYVSQPSNLEGLRGHPSIERLSLDRSASDRTMMPLFQSMSHLRELTVAATHSEIEGGIRESYKKALPGCKCRVIEDDR